MNTSMSFTLKQQSLKPPNWRWHSFKNSAGYKIRFGTCSPKDSVPDAVIIGLQGLSEYTEKYFELANDLQNRNFAFWMMDWCGQGGSDRYLDNPHKRHVNSFDQDIIDLHQFIDGYVRHSAVHPEVGRIPLVMLGHSMGGHLGLRYIEKHPDVFDAAACSAPMIGMKVFENLPSFLISPLLFLLSMASPKSYAPTGETDWNPDIRDQGSRNVFSNDSYRRYVHNEWMRKDETLRLGTITLKWLNEAYKSCRSLQKFDLSSIDMPFLLALAEDEMLVSNKTAEAFFNTAQDKTYLHLKGAKHEILMESDDIRNQFIDALVSMLEQNNIKERRRTF